MSVATPRVSVVVPAYNYAHYLPAAIDSALGQDYPADAIEVVVVDDGSTDGTPEVVAGYGDRITAIRRPNGGLNAATQTGIEAATGELITFLDADDTWPAGRTRALAGALVRAPWAGIAYGDMAIVDETGKVLHATVRRTGGVVAHSGRVFGRLLAGNFVSAGALMIRASMRELYCPLPEAAPYQDWWMATQVAREAEIIAIDDVVNLYRHHGENMNLGVEATKRADLFASEIPFRRFLLETAEGLASPRELLQGVRGLDQRVQYVAEARGIGPREVLALGPDDRGMAVAALHDASAELDAGRLEGALAALVRSVAHDPLYSEARELIGQLASHVSPDRVGAP